MIRIPGRYRPFSNFPSFSSRLVKYRTALFLGGAALLLLLLVPGSLSVFAQLGTPVAPVLLSIAVTPADAEILPGGTQHFTATGTYSDRHIHELSTTVTWSSSAPDVATISSGGLARAVGLGLGQTTIKAAVGAIKGSTTLNVTSFVFTGSMNTDFCCHSATLLNNGMVLVAGGWNYSGGTLASAELYNPSTGTFAPTGSLNTARQQHTATLLDNGMVLIAGGLSPYSSSGTLASAELYNPATGTFTPTGSLNIERWGHTATLLSNGMVLITGTWGSGGTAELYNPATGTFSYTKGSMNVAPVDQMATLLNNGMVLI
ncbi:MAG: kelch repeat-containing protein, partial [Terriglobales bacterium]